MIKQVIILRTDLNMRKGKMVAQGAHACLKAFLEYSSNAPKLPIELVHKWDKIIPIWFESGQTKIVVGIDSEEGLKELYKQAKEAQLICSYVIDAGKTEFKQPTATAVAIGPAKEEDVDRITRNLKLL